MTIPRAFIFPAFEELFTRAGMERTVTFSMKIWPIGPSCLSIGMGKLGTNARRPFTFSTADEKEMIAPLIQWSQYANTICCMFSLWVGAKSISRYWKHDEWYHIICNNLNESMMHFKWRFVIMETSTICCYFHRRYARCEFYLSGSLWCCVDEVGARRVSRHRETDFYWRSLSVVYLSFCVDVSCWNLIKLL